MGKLISAGRLRKASPRISYLKEAWRWVVQKCVSVRGGRNIYPNGRIGCLYLFALAGLAVCIFALAGLAVCIFALQDWLFASLLWQDWLFVSFCSTLLILHMTPPQHVRRLIRLCP